MSVFKRWRAIAVSALVAAACGKGQKTQSTAAVTTDTLTAALSGLHVGDVVPRYAAVILAGDSIAIGGAADAVVLLNVWATWCTSCREEMQDLEQLHQSYTPHGVRVVAVSLDAGSETLVRRFVTREQLSFPVVHDQEGRLQALYRVGGVPSTYVIGRDGRLVWQRTGGLHGSIDLARAALETALTGSTASAAP